MVYRSLIDFIGGHRNFYDSIGIAERAGYEVLTSISGIQSPEPFSEEDGMKLERIAEMNREKLFNIENLVRSIPYTLGALSCLGTHPFRIYMLLRDGARLMSFEEAEA